MKIITILSQLFLIAISFSCADSSAKNSTPTISDKGFAVVELFTSEGCSSCPPADAAVANLLKEHASNVYVLGYHVDYWNNLGWKDIFSNAAYTQLQRNYGRVFQLSSVYTPQIVVNGTDQFVGSDVNKLNAAVNKDLVQSPTVKLGIEATSTNNKTVTVNYTTDAADAKLKVALIQLSAEDKIKRGENSGATLHHVNIVRDLQTVVASASGKITLNIPAGLDVKDCRVIAFTQNINDSKITAATEININ
ncbi:MAG: DUF1223 domain-containing protein [Parafilimonas sp.]